VGLQIGAGRDRLPVGLGGGAVGGFVAVDLAKARFPIVGWDIEPDSAEVGQFGVETRTHQPTDERVALAFDQQRTVVGFPPLVITPPASPRLFMGIDDHQARSV